MGKMKGALIGCGFFAVNQMHGWRDLADVKIVAICDRDPDLMATLQSHAAAYRRHFGFDFVMFVGAMTADEVLRSIADRMHHDHETERKVVRNELARINRTRLERMLGPEGGYDNW